ncbi:peptidylprolyl isomerase [Psychromonas hadalis]|uniref:peptidylprolyl isomerase n=1 Tax=Psychromonas hadalis TaxID=211669 RepID=UPI0003B67135|nr:peptidylprolyl isomerase [Psychromonas hadalis]
MITLHTNFGDIKLELNEEKAPKTVANFIQYAESGHYDNTIFHRVIDGFMVQGGGFASGMEEKETNKPVKNEANNGLSNKKYSIAMARTMEPHSASAQFFININDNKFLDFKSETNDGWGYCVFAEVVDGFDIVDKIKGVATGNFGFVHQDVPLEDVFITHVTVG